MSKCNCYQERLEEVKKAISEQREGVKDLELNWVGRTYNLSGRDTSPVTPKIEFSYFKPKKGGGFRANRTKEEVYLEAKFCTFCGREYGKSKEDSIKAIPWIDKTKVPVNTHSDWVVGEKAMAIDFNSCEPYAFEIEWDGDCWCSIGGDEFTHWIPLPEPVEGW